MTELTLRIPPEMERQLAKNARQRGESIEEYILTLMRHEIALRPVSSKAGEADRAKMDAFDLFVKQSHEMTRDIPSLRDDALTRAREDQGNRQL